jgi:hypothetical protein
MGQREVLLETHWELEEHIDNLMGRTKTTKPNCPLHPTFPKRKTKEPLGEDVTACCLMGCQEFVCLNIFKCYKYPMLRLN